MRLCRQWLHTNILHLIYYQRETAGLTRIARAGCGLFVLLILSSEGQRKGTVGQEQIIAWSVREGYFCVNGRAIMAKMLGLFTQISKLMKCENDKALDAAI